MQPSVRTTIRIRKDLLDQSRLVAFKRGTTLQDVINDTLAHGFSHVSKLTAHQEAMDQIKAFREGLRGRSICSEKILRESKKRIHKRFS